MQSPQTGQDMAILAGRGEEASGRIGAGPRMDRLPTSPFHHRILRLIAAGMFCDAFEIYLQAGVLAALLSAGWSTPAQNANFVSATFAGMVLGAGLAGLVGDRFGRRFCYQFNLLLFSLASFAAALSPTMDWLIAARVVIGIGLGAEIVVGYVTLSEFVPPNVRGRWGAVLSVLTNSALFASAVLGRVLLPSVGWRWMFVAVGVAGVSIWWMRKAMPESPRWLEAVGRLEDCDRLVDSIEAEVATTSKAPLPPPMDSSAPASARLGWGSLFGRELRTRTLVGAVSMVTMNTMLYGLVTFLPTFLIKQGVTLTASLSYTMLMALGAPVGATLAIPISDRFGRRPMLVAVCVCIAVFAALYPYAREPVLLMLDGFLMVSGIFVFTAIVTSAYLSELFPTAIRMRGAGVCNAIGRLSSVFTPQLILIVLAPHGINAVVLYVCGLLAIQILVVLAFGIETKGKSLETLAVAAGVVPLVGAEGGMLPARQS